MFLDYFTGSLSLTFLFPSIKFMYICFCSFASININHSHRTQQCFYRSAHHNAQLTASKQRSQRQWHQLNTWWMPYTCHNLCNCTQCNLQTNNHKVHLTNTKSTNVEKQRITRMHGRMDWLVCHLKIINICSVRMFSCCWSSTGRLGITVHLCTVLSCPSGRPAVTDNTYHNYQFTIPCKGV